MDVLEDVLGPNLKVVFCGTGAGNKSARTGYYYANPGNKFWRILSRISVTPCVFKPCEFRKLLQYGIGLTDLSKKSRGPDEHIDRQEFRAGRDDFRTKMEKFKSRVVAFNGKRAAAEFFECERKELSYGRQSQMIAKSTLFVLPSTSPSSAGSWDESHWKKLADFVNR